MVCCDGQKSIFNNYLFAIIEFTAVLTAGINLEVVSTINERN